MFAPCWHMNILKRTSETHVRKFIFRLKRNELRELIWLIKLEPRAVKYQSTGFPWYAAHDVPRPWFFLTRRNGRIRNMTLSHTSRFLTRHVLISDTPNVKEFHGHVNSTKLLISRSDTTTTPRNETKGKRVPMVANVLYVLQKGIISCDHLTKSEV